MAIALKHDSLVLGLQQSALLYAVAAICTVAIFHLLGLAGAWLVATQSVVIYGAGDAGAQLAIALNAGRRMYPVAYVN